MHLASKDPAVLSSSASSGSSPSSTMSSAHASSLTTFIPPWSQWLLASFATSLSFLAQPVALRSASCATSSMAHSDSCSKPSRTSLSISQHLEMNDGSITSKCLATLSHSHIYPSSRNSKSMLRHYRRALNPIWMLLGTSWLSLEFPSAFWASSCPSCATFAPGIPAVSLV